MYDFREATVRKWRREIKTFVCAIKKRHVAELAKKCELKTCRVSGTNGVQLPKHESTEKGL